VVLPAKAAALEPVEVRVLLGRVGGSTLAGLRDRALIHLMLYSFVRIGATLSMKIEGVFTLIGGYACGTMRRREARITLYPVQFLRSPRGLISGRSFHIVLGMSRTAESVKVLVALQDTLIGFLDDHRNHAMQISPRRLKGWAQSPPENRWGSVGCDCKDCLLAEELLNSILTILSGTLQ